MKEVNGGGGGSRENVNDSKEALSFLLILIPVADTPTVTHRQEIGRK
jgi:hypothetical protein